MYDETTIVRVDSSGPYWYLRVPVGTTLLELVRRVEEKCGEGGYHVIEIHRMDPSINPIKGRSVVEDF